MDSGYLKTVGFNRSLPAFGNSLECKVDVFIGSAAVVDLEVDAEIISFRQNHARVLRGQIDAPGGKVLFFFSMGEGCG